MAHEAVTLKIKPCLRVKCKFWLADDGWNGTSDSPSMVVWAPSFEQAKSDMELALGKHIQKLLRESGESKSEQAA